MSYKNKYLKYKSKYIHLKQIQSGGNPALQQQVDTSVKNMSLDELVNFDLENINKNIKTNVLERNKLDNSYLPFLTPLNELGSGHFASTKKIQITDDIKKGDQIILPKDSIVLGKYIEFISDNQAEVLSHLENEITAYSTISLTDCNLPKLYGYFDHVLTDNKTYYLMLVEFTEGDNMLNTIMKTNMSLKNQIDIDNLSKWVYEIENTLKCLPSQAGKAPNFSWGMRGHLI